MSDVVDPDSVGFTIIWKIENFSYAWQEMGSRLETPVFTVNFLDETIWRLVLNPAGSSFYFKDTITCYPLKLATEPYIISLHHELSFLRADGLPEVSFIGYASWIHRGAPDGEHFVIPFDEVLGKRRHAFLPGDTLTVRCRIFKPYQICLEPVVALARTVMGVEKKSFIWTIKNFSALKAYDRNQITVDSTSGRFKPLTITLILDGGSSGNRSIHFEVDRSEDDQRNYTTLNMSVLDAHQKVAFQSQDEFLFEPMKGKQIWILPLLVSRQKLIAAKDTLLPDDVLSLKCDFGTSVGILFNGIESISHGCNLNTCKEEVLSNTDQLLRPERGTGSEQPCSSLTEDLRHLLDQNSLCDMTIKVCQKTFHAHKAILGARSSVFKSMFNSDMKEKLTNCIEVEDLEPETLRRLLLYMYTDTLEDMQWEAASQLYSAADKYDILSLRKRCSSILKDDLTTSNACEVLILADMHHDEGLKSSVQDYIQVHDKEIIRSIEWKHLEQKNAPLALETVSRMYRNMKEF